MNPVGRADCSRYQAEALRNWIENSSVRSADGKGHLDSAAADVGIGEDLYLTALQVFQHVLHDIRGQAVLRNERWSNLKEDLQKFVLWGDGFCNGKLDQALNQSGHLKTEVLTVLTSIAELLLRAHKRLHTSALTEAPVLALQGLFERAGEIVEEHGSNTTYSVSEESGDDKKGDSSDDSDESDGNRFSSERCTSRNWAVQLCKDMHCNMTSLMDLAFSIEQTLKYADLSLKRIQAPPVDSFKVSDPAQVYVSNILDKFPQADIGLVERLGQKNWERHQIIRLRQQQIEEASSTEEKDVAPSLFMPFSLFHDSGLGLSTGASSSYAASAVSHTSFVSSIAEGEKRAWRVPPLPVEAASGKPFICSICGQTQHKIKNRVDWKIHIFADLQPYICTFPQCSSGLITFPKRSLWAEHEFNVHRMKKTWICHVCSLECKSIPELQDHLSRKHDTAFSGPLAQVGLDAAEKRNELEIKDLQCPFCFGFSAITRRGFVTHVSRHMEEVALAALPIDEPLDASEAGSIANDKANSVRLVSDEELYDPVSDIRIEDLDAAYLLLEGASVGNKDDYRGFLGNSRELLGIIKGNETPHQSDTGSPINSASKSRSQIADVEEIRKAGEDAAGKIARGKTKDEVEENTGEESSAADQSGKRMATYFLEGTGIDRELITRDITLYLGKTALVRPGAQKNPRTKEVENGFYITAYRILTAAQINDLKADSAEWRARNRSTSTYREKSPKDARPQQTQSGLVR